ncbi:MAG TPA: outer membrane beta-barrel protein, partial [Chitinophagaceae bacterium]|nr:outer membrane beta-barrel protein [Chitinophagaceae bacterium]
GLNYTDKWGSKIDVTGSYFFSNQNSHNESSSVRQTFFPNDSSTVQNSESRSWNMNQNHRFNLRMEYYIDSNNSILYAPNFVVQHSETESYDTNFTYSNIPGKQYLSIIGATSNNNIRDGFNLNNYLLFRHRFKKYGRTFTLGFNNSNNKSNGEGSNVSPLTFYNPDGSVSRVKNQDLENTQDTKSFNNVLSASYTEPIGKNKLLEVNYAYTNNHSTSDRRAYDFNSGTGKYDEINKLQTNYFENDFIAHRAGLNFQVHETKFNYQLGLAMQQSELNSRSVRASTAKDTTLSQSFVNFFPTANFQYQWSRSKNLRIRYRGRTNQPSINQLQDVPDVSNPLQIVTGNPDLKQEFENNLNLNYHTFNMESFKFFNININVSNTNNKIVNSIDSVAKGSGLDSIGKGIILIRPVNLNGAMNASSYVTLGLPLRGKLEGSNFNFNNRISYNRDVSLLYKQRNVTNSFSVTQTAGINLNLKDKYNFGINASLTYNNVTYSVKNSGNLDQEYYTQSYSADINYLGLKDWVFGTDFDYIRNTGLGEGYNQSIPLWNASIAREVLKARNGEIKFSVNDILNQNKSISRSVGNNYIQDTRALVIKRYFMLTLTYNLRKGNAPENGGRREMPPGVNRRYFRMRG